MHPDSISYYAAASFGLEGLVASELKRLSMKQVLAENGGVRFSGSLPDGFLCNLRLRFSDRVYIILAEKETHSFEDLFQLVFSIPWEKLCAGNEKMLITAQNKAAFIPGKRRGSAGSCSHSRKSYHDSAEHLRRFSLPERIQNLERRSASSRNACLRPH